LHYGQRRRRTLQQVPRFDKETATCGGLFNAFGNVASIVTPLVIGYLVKELHSFIGALIFVGASAVAAMLCYLFVVGKISRTELKL
jgi:ACS family probable galactarate transporter